MYLVTEQFLLSQVLIGTSVAMQSESFDWSSGCHVMSGQTHCVSREACVGVPAHILRAILGWWYGCETGDKVVLHGRVGWCHWRSCGIGDIGDGRCKRRRIYRDKAEQLSVASTSTGTWATSSRMALVQRCKPVGLGVRFPARAAVRVSVTLVLCVLWL